ncbi:MAG: class I SAM-dependent methyltransferase [Xanthomonadales bacterium]|nr:class I SAM-dependent methyltransferase [Xanthomonadales bacterium]
MDQYPDIEVDGSDTDAPLNVARRVAIVRQYLPPGDCRLLDCGCGAGGYLMALEEQAGVPGYGLEFEQKKVDTAHARGLHPSRVIQGDIQAMPYPDSSFDTVLLNEVLEHVPDQQAGLDEIHRVLKPGGHLLVFSPNRGYPFETHGVRRKSSGKSLPFHTPFIPWLPLRIATRWLDFPARNYWPAELRSLLKAHGFEYRHHQFVWQTFENLTGLQPAWMRATRGTLRRLSLVLEKTPLIRRMGISQFVAVQKPSRP